MFLRSAAGGDGVGVLAIARATWFVVAVDWAALGPLRRRNIKVHDAVLFTVDVSDCVAEAANLVVVSGLDSWGHVGVQVLLGFWATGHAGDYLATGVEVGVGSWYDGLDSGGDDGYESGLLGLAHCQYIGGQQVGQGTVLWWLSVSHAFLWRVA